MQAERALSDEAAFAAAAAGLQRPRVDGGPFVDTDVPSFLRLVRTGERWFELQTAVVTYASPRDSQALALPQAGRATHPVVCRNRAPTCCFISPCLGMAVFNSDRFVGFGGSKGSGKWIWLLWCTWEIPCTTSTSRR